MAGGGLLPDLWSARSARGADRVPAGNADAGKRGHVHSAANLYRGGHGDRHLGSNIGDGYSTGAGEHADSDAGRGQHPDSGIADDRAAVGTGRSAALA